MASNNLITDLRWMSKGGLLLDSSGDLCFTETSTECIQDMISTRIQADLNAWKLYSIGADLNSIIGNAVESELEVTIQKQVTAALTNDFLTSDAFTVSTIQMVNYINIYVYYQGTLIASTTVSLG